MNVRHRKGPDATIGIRSIVSLYPRIGSGGLVGPSVPGVPGRVVTFTDFKTWPNSMPNTTPVSYTHLTLPTILLV